MIIENLQKSDIKTIGDIQKIKASIDVENIDFITTILSSNLYSSPMESFLREIVSNAWDSHVEAGNTGEPVIIRIKDDSITVRDYGTGLDKKEFEDIYCKIGTSTKRESNDYIGMFGIGKFASLAVSDVVYIHSYYDGKDRSYVMIKENGTITTNFLGESDSEEKNGLSITVPINNCDIEKAKNALDYLVFFPNIYVDYQIFVKKDSDINKAKITRYKNFSVASTLGRWVNNEFREKIWILLGNVLYPLDTTKINCNITSQQLKNMKSCNICLNMNIGEINITPNRESIIYSESTIKIINERLLSATDEINDIINSKTKHDCKTILEYYQKQKKSYSWNPIDNEISEIAYEGWVCNLDLTFNGEKKSDTYNSAIKTLGNMKVPGCTKFLNNGVFQTNLRGCYSARTQDTVLANLYIAFEDNRKISGYAKRFILEECNYDKVCFISRMSEEKFIWELIDNSMFHEYDKTKVDKDVISVAKELYFWVSTHTSIIKTNEINDFKEQIKKDEKQNGLKKTDNSLYSIHEFDLSDYVYSSDKLTSSPVKFSYIIKILQKEKKVILHNGKDITHDRLEPYKVLWYLGYSILWCSNSLYNKLVKYITCKDNKKHLNNVFLDYNEVLDNLSQAEECKIVYSRFVNMHVDKNEYCYTTEIVYKFLKYINKSDDFMTIYNEFTKQEYHLEKLSKFDIIKKYEVKSIRAKSLEEYIKNILKLVNKYYGLESITNSYNVRCRELDIYIFCKWCIKSKININFSEYNKLKINKLIKLVYEQTY